MFIEIQNINYTETNIEDMFSECNFRQCLVYEKKNIIYKENLIENVFYDVFDILTFDVGQTRRTDKPKPFDCFVTI